MKETEIKIPLSGGYRGKNSRREGRWRTEGWVRMGYITEEKWGEDIIMVLDLKSLLSNVLMTKPLTHWVHNERRP